FLVSSKGISICILGCKFARLILSFCKVDLAELLDGSCKFARSYVAELQDCLSGKASKALRSFLIFNLYSIVALRGARRLKRKPSLIMPCSSLWMVRSEQAWRIRLDISGSDINTHISSSFPVCSYCLFVRFSKIDVI